MSFKDAFIEIYEREITREGSAKLLDYIKSSDFFDAPASTKFHLARKGGLCEHSLNVYYRLKELVEREKADWSERITPETVAICGLLHDLCKIDLYAVDYRNQKQPDGSWEKVPYYTTDENDQLAYGKLRRTQQVGRLHYVQRLFQIPVLCARSRGGPFGDLPRRRGLENLSTRRNGARNISEDNRLNLIQGERYL